MYHFCLVFASGQMNDARMNVAIAMTAAREGAALANHVEVISLIKEKVHGEVLMRASGGLISGVRPQYRGGLISGVV